MIEHKRIKAICAVVLAALVAVGTAVPCFASVATDDSGNFLPSSYYVEWSIYDTDTESYKSVDVTSSLSVDGLTFTFPYNSTGVIAVRMTLYAGLGTDNVYINGISFNGYASYTGVSSLEEFSSDCYFNRYYYASSTLTRVGYNFGSSNPFSFLQSFDTLQPFNRCSFWFYTNIVSGSLTIHFNSLIIGGEDITSLITVQNLDDAGDDLINLAEDLAVPTPAIDVDSIVDDALSDADMESVGDVWSFMSNDLITKMLLIVVSFALLGYILYGKKEAGN